MLKSVHRHSPSLSKMQSTPHLCTLYDSLEMILTRHPRRSLKCTLARQLLSHPQALRSLTGGPACHQLGGCVNHPPALVRSHLPHSLFSNCSLKALQCITYSERQTGPNGGKVKQAMLLTLEFLIRSEKLPPRNTIPLPQSSKNIPACATFLPGNCR